MVLKHLLFHTLATIFSVKLSKVTQFLWMKLGLESQRAEKGLSVGLLQIEPSWFFSWIADLSIQTIAVIQLLKHGCLKLCEMS